LGEEVRRVASVVVLALLLVVMLPLAIDVRQVSSAPATIIVPDDYPTIQEAINAANNGDTIFVRKGTYYENVIVNKTVSLIGEDAYTTVVYGDGIRDIMKITASNVSFSGFTVTENIFLDSQIFRCAINATSSYNNICHNIILNGGVWGISLKRSNNNTISNNTILPCPHNWRIGIRILNSSNNTISHNNITRNRDGICLVGDSKHNEVTNNKVLDNYMCGIYLEDTFWLHLTVDNNTIAANFISGSRYGIDIQSGANNNSIYENLLIGNQLGVYFYYKNSNHNRFYHNSFVCNTVQVNKREAVNFWDNGYEGNYWDDYNGTDSDDNGIGDSPYIIDGNNTDNYPLMEPHLSWWSLYLWNLADIDHNLKVDIFDVVLVANAYGSIPSDPNWNPRCDIAESYGIIDILDIVAVAGSYGEEYNP
jgi:parallel beta-helix repeat protein